MILWTIKQLFSLKKAITGRANPSELAWGLALGLAIGLIPKGNLVSVMMIGLLVSLRVNHGMAALTAVGVSFLAFRFDPWTHQLGAEVLQAPKTRELMQRFWDTPLVPWTDLNNTVVMGSTIIGLGSVIPTFLISLPVFRWLSPKKKLEQDLDPPPSVAAAMPVPGAVLISEVSTACTTAEPVKAVGTQRELHVVGLETPGADDSEKIEERSLEQTSDGKTGSPRPASRQLGPHIETQIEIIRMKPKEEIDLDEDTDGNANGPMNEALGYLIRRLRDSRQEKAA